MVKTQMQRSRGQEQSNKMFFIKAKQLSSKIHNYMIKPGTVTRNQDKTRRKELQEKTVKEGQGSWKGEKKKTISGARDRRDETDRRARTWK